MYLEILDEARQECREVFSSPNIARYSFFEDVVR